MEKILNKKKFREKDQYLVRWKGYTVKEDTQEPRENLGNTEDLVKEFKEEYSEIRRVRKRRNNKEDRKGELPGRYTAKMLFGWDDKRFDEEYWRQLERNWKKWKGRKQLEDIEEEEAKENRREEQDKENEMENIRDPYNKLQEIFEMKIFKRGYCHESPRP